MCLQLYNSSTKRSLTEIFACVLRVSCESSTPVDYSDKTTLVVHMEEDMDTRANETEVLHPLVDQEGIKLDILIGFTQILSKQKLLLWKVN